MNDLCGLAIEAATDQLSLAACRGERVEVLELIPARDHTQRVYEYCQRLLDAVGGRYEALDFVAFGCGPGSFTGVRIAAAAAQAIAFANAIRVCRISSLAVLAAGASRRLGAAAFGICLDARMGNAYAALYGDGQPPQCVMADALVNPRDLTLPGTGPLVALGDGWTTFPDVLARHRSRILSIEDGLLPSARDLLSMAVADFRAGRTVAPEDGLPEYLGQSPARAGPR